MDNTSRWRTVVDWGSFASFAIPASTHDGSSVQREKTTGDDFETASPALFRRACREEREVSEKQRTRHEGGHDDDDMRTRNRKKSEDDYDDDQPSVGVEKKDDQPNEGSRRRRRRRRRRTSANCDDDLVLEAELDGDGGALLAGAVVARVGGGRDGELLFGLDEAAEGGALEGPGRRGEVGAVVAEEEEGFGVFVLDAQAVGGAGALEADAADAAGAGDDGLDGDLLEAVLDAEAAHADDLFVQ
mmetsp:Transcript_11469/g.34314  ORF Transcript_11469/g.34314 Transcript_11469/m.34314 type:complete len:244 (+) Transcript_11469:222-953(+)